MSVYLKALKLQFYRGIGPESQPMAPFRDFNFFIGANNSGKSTVLNFISQNLPFKEGKTFSASGIDVYRGQKTGQLSASIGISEDDFLKNVLVKHPNLNEHIQNYVKKISKKISDDGFIWLKPTEGRSFSFSTSENISTLKHSDIIDDNAWYNLWNTLTNKSGGSVRQHWFPESIQALITCQNTSLPKVKLIPALREIGKRSGRFDDFNGDGLIDRLAEIQSPDHDMRHEEKLFQRINRFLQNVTGKHDSRIEIPHNRDHVLVHMDNKVLPLSSLGMGIHEVIMIASFCTITEKSIVCIEEPEIHIHPILQRKLVSYLKLETDNQYFIATHSASFIDTPDSAIFHVTNDGVQTRIAESILRSQRHSICQDLGYKASDIVQSNAVIWVEGPSDRLYIRFWINAVAPDLIEGIQYSIMFYGGRLLSHLSADSDDLNEFISLRSLNRYIAIVIDSDRSASGKAINDTKIRLKDELDRQPSVCWITKGREIENYVEYSVLQKAVQACYTEVYDRHGDPGPYKHALHFYRKSPKRRRRKGLEADTGLLETGVDKVAVARAVCNQPANLDVLDLRMRIEELVSMIRLANQ